MKKQSHDPSQSPDTPEILLDDPAADIEAAMRDALSAVEAVEADTPQAPAAGTGLSVAPGGRTEREHE